MPSPALACAPSASATRARCAGRPSVRGATRLDLERTALDRCLYGCCAWSRRPRSPPAGDGRSAPGSRRLPIAGPSVVRADGFSRTRPGREQEPRSEPQRRQPTVPRHRFLTPRCAQASPALGGEQRARRAIALSSHDTRGRRFGWRRCAAALWRLSMPLARAGERPPAWSSPEREGARSPPAPQTRDTDHRAASPLAQTSMAACPLPSCTIVFLPPAGHRHRPQHLHSPCPPQSLPKNAAAPLALPPAVDLVRTSAPAQNDPSAVFECSSQLPSRCCDDHLNPPNTSPSDTPSAWRRLASSLRWVASATLTTMLSLKPSTASTRPRSSIGVDHGG